MVKSLPPAFSIMRLPLSLRLYMKSPSTTLALIDAITPTALSFKIIAVPEVVFTTTLCRTMTSPLRGVIV
jgi:hypothetical protein